VPSAQGMKYGTNLNHRDTDADGLNDNIEIEGWMVQVDSEQPYRVYSNAVVAQDSNAAGLFDNDGMLDAQEYAYGSDPGKYDTDIDGTNDLAELSIYSNFSNRHRNPVQKDRKITLSYQSLVYSGECDTSAVWWDQYNDIEYVLGVRSDSLDNVFIPLAYSASSPDDQLCVGHVSVGDNHTFTFSSSNSINFIARYGEKFEFYGYSKELDSAGGFLVNWTHLDGGILFHDSDCNDCESLFMKDSYDNTMGVFTTEILRSTVGQVTANTDILVETSESCHTSDILSNIYPFGIASGFSMDISAKIKVE
jgi:hypothetical protein